LSGFVFHLFFFFFSDLSFFSTYFLSLSIFFSFVFPLFQWYFSFECNWIEFLIFRIKLQNDNKRSAVCNRNDFIKCNNNFTFLTKTFQSL
jgi:hypothetical protein